MTAQHPHLGAGTTDGASAVGPGTAAPDTAGPGTAAPDTAGPDVVDPDIDLRVPAQRRETDPLLLAVIALGGVLGAEARYGAGRMWPHPSDGFAWTTVAVNASGCLLIGVLMVLITEVVTPHRLVRPFLGVGILGGFTTFSTASVDAVSLWHAHRPGVAGGYVAATVLSALGAVWCAVVLTRTVTRAAARAAGRRHGRATR